MFGHRFAWVRIVALVVGLAVWSGCGENLEAHSSPTQLAPTADHLATLIAQQQPTYTATVTPSVTLVPPKTLAPAKNSPTDEPTAVAQVQPTDPSSTPTPTPIIPTIPPTNTLAPSPTPITPSPTMIPTNTPRPTQEPQMIVGTEFDLTGELRDHYWFARPFPRDPSNEVHDFASRNYPYGSTAAGSLQTHHGMDFQNLLGTPILAVASGTVFYAGDDLEMQFGPRNDFYGNLVIIEHDTLAPNGKPLYTLYGHMFRVEVEAGQRVELGDKLGSVGATGVALGAHLHLEVRIGDPYDYGSTYNPDLWLKPWRGYGTLAGRIWDRDGKRMYDTNIVIQPVDDLDRYSYSYADDGVNPDPYYGEHFTCGDLPVGTYQVLIRVRGVLRYKGEVTIVEGQTSWLEINVN
ncbi:MAG: M23 family metallopeptidase [Anaerolineae bacterium]|nr:M23 family metallopeptidase [Anaerolineae bacterium]